MKQIIDNSGKILAIVLKSEIDFKEGKNFFTKDETEMQLATFNLPKDTVIDKHVHITQERTTQNTSEAIIVIDGMIQVDIYDESRLLICSEILAYGDVIALFSGGHGIKIIEDAKFVETKQGPYLQEKDKYKF